MDELKPSDTQESLTPDPLTNPAPSAGTRPFSPTDSFNGTASSNEPMTPPISVPKKSHKMKLWAPIIVVASALIVFAALAVPHFLENKSTATTASTPQSTTATTNPSDTTDQGLTNDYNSLQSSQNQESTDQNSATSSLNDSSQQISIPTN